MYQVSMFGRQWETITKTEVVATLAKAGLDVAECLQKLESGEKVTLAFVAFRKLESERTNRWAIS